MAQDLHPPPTVAPIVEIVEQHLSGDARWGAEVEQVTPIRETNEQCISASRVRGRG